MIRVGHSATMTDPGNQYLSLSTRIEVGLLSDAIPVAPHQDLPCYQDITCGSVWVEST